MPLSSQQVRRRFLYTLLIGILLLCCASPFAWYQHECRTARYPETFPNASPTVTSETITASMVTRDTTKTYVVRGQIEDVERFYMQQMQRVCQQAEIVPFQVVTDTEHLQPYHQASCWIKGENIPAPTFSAAMKKFDEPESRSIVYRVIKQTVQTFRVELVKRSATEVEVTHSEFFTTAC